MEAEGVDFAVREERVAFLGAAFLAAFFAVRGAFFAVFFAGAVVLAEGEVSWDWFWELSEDSVAVTYALSPQLQHRVISATGPGALLTVSRTEDRLRHYIIVWELDMQAITLP